MFKSLFGRKDSFDDNKKLETAKSLARYLQIQISLAGKHTIADGNGCPNRKAIGYVYGVIDAALTARKLDMSDVSVGVPVMFHVLRELWPDRAKDYLEFVVENTEDPIMAVGMMKGGQEYVDFMNSKKMPTGLAKILITEVSESSHPEATLQPDLFNSEPISSVFDSFDFGFVGMHQSIDDLAGLVEFSSEKYAVFQRASKDEKSYDAPPIEFLGGEWQLMISSVHGLICKIAVSIVLSDEHEANSVGMEAFQYCEERLGSPSEENAELSIWDTEDGNVILQTGECAGEFVIALNLTSKAIRERAKPTSAIAY